MTLEKFLEPLPQLIEAEILKDDQVKSVAKNNYLDNFILFYAGKADSVIMEEFVLLDDLRLTNCDMWDWLNKYSKTSPRTNPFIKKCLEGIYTKLRA